MDESLEDKIALIISDGCGCDEFCKEAPTCGCREDAIRIIELVIATRENLDAD